MRRAAGVSGGAEGGWPRGPLDFLLAPDDDLEGLTPFEVLRSRPDLLEDLVRLDSRRAWSRLAARAAGQRVRSPYRFTGPRHSSLPVLGFACEDADDLGHAPRVRAGAVLLREASKQVLFRPLDLPDGLPAQQAWAPSASARDRIAAQARWAATRFRHTAAAVSCPASVRLKLPVRLATSASAAQYRPITPRSRDFSRSFGSTQ